VEQTNGKVWNLVVMKFPKQYHL